MSEFTELGIAEVKLAAAELPINILCAQVARGVDSNLTEPILTAPQGYINDAVNAVVSDPNLDTENFLQGLITEKLIDKAIAKLQAYKEAHPLV